VNSSFLVFGSGNSNDGSSLRCLGVHILKMTIFWTEWYLILFLFLYFMTGGDVVSAADWQCFQIKKIWNQFTINGEFLMKESTKANKCIPIQPRTSIITSGLFSSIILDKTSIGLPKTWQRKDLEIDFDDHMSRGLPKVECFGRRPKILKIRLLLRPPKVSNLQTEGLAEGLIFRNEASEILKIFFYEIIFLKKKSILYEFFKFWLTSEIFCRKVEK